MNKNTNNTCEHCSQPVVQYPETVCQSCYLASIGYSEQAEYEADCKSAEAVIVSELRRWDEPHGLRTVTMADGSEGWALFRLAPFAGGSEQISAKYDCPIALLFSGWFDVGSFWRDGAATVYTRCDTSHSKGWRMVEARA